MDFYIPVSGLSYPVSTSFCYNYLLPLAYLDSDHFAQEGAHPLDHVPLLSGLVVLATIWRASTNTLAYAHQQTWTRTYMDSGYRISKTSPVNPVSTLFIPRPVVTGTAKGQYWLFQIPHA